MLRRASCIHHSTRVSKHEVVAALLEAAAGRSERGRRKLGGREFER